MSLLNAWIMRDEALVAVDSDGVDRDGGRMPTSKLLTIPHLNVVMGLRGQLAFLGLLFLRCISAGLDSYDELVAALPEMLVHVDDACPESLIVQTNIGNELVVAGWSVRRGRMAGRLFFKRDGMEAFQGSEIESFFVSPWDRSMPDIPKTPAAVEKISRAQVRWMRQSFPNAACGGKLITAVTTRKGVTVNHRATFQ